MKTPDEILKQALQKETAAHDFYAKLARECKVEFVSELLEKLQHEESRHMRMVEDMIARLATDHRIP